MPFYIDVPTAFSACGASALLAAAFVAPVAGADGRHREAQGSAAFGFLLIGLGVCWSALGTAWMEHPLGLWITCSCTMAGILLVGNSMGLLSGHGMGRRGVMAVALAGVVAISVAMPFGRSVFGWVFMVANAVLCSVAFWQARLLVVRPSNLTELVASQMIATLIVAEVLRVPLMAMYFDGTPRSDQLYMPEWLRSVYALLFATTPAAAAPLVLSLVNRELRQRLLDAAHTDDLTGLLNRRALREKAAAMLERKRSTDAALALLVMDLDHFKVVNDRFGHQAGDAVLARVARVLRQHLRPEDLLARYGGEEFVALAVLQDGEDALRVAERLRQALRAHHWPEQAGFPEQVTVSIGAAVLLPGEAFDAAFARADRALYEAKALGRDRSRPAG